MSTTTQEQRVALTTERVGCGWSERFERPAAAFYKGSPADLQQHQAAWDRDQANLKRRDEILAERAAEKRAAKDAAAQAEDARLAKRAAVLDEARGRFLVAGGREADWPAVEEEVWQRHLTAAATGELDTDDDRALQANARRYG